MKSNHIKFSLFLGMNNSVQGFREMDFHTFSHQGETYFSIIVANLSNDITKLDLAFGMIRKLIDLINDTDKLSLLTNNHKLNKISYLFIWLNTKLKIIDHEFALIKRTDLQKYVINNYFDNNYYENIDTVKQF